MLWVFRGERLKVRGFREFFRIIGGLDLEDDFGNCGRGNKREVDD